DYAVALMRRQLGENLGKYNFILPSGITLNGQKIWDQGNQDVLRLEEKCIKDYSIPFFNLYDFKSEQDLLQSLIVEAIGIAGINVYYIPRNIINYDQLYQTDDQSTYTNAIPVDVYLEDYGGFGGQQNIYNK